MGKTARLTAVGCPFPRGLQSLRPNRGVSPTAGLRTRRHIATPTNRRFPVHKPVLNDGVRSCLPLRGSSGVSPDSLSRSRR